jgi:hypothetical protein
MVKEDLRLTEEDYAKSADTSLGKNNSLLKYKIFTDKIGAGFSSIQFLNILFFITGASVLMIGVINGLKSAVTAITSSIVKRQTEKGHFSTDLMIVSGMFFGFSFLFMAMAVSLKWKWLFAASILIGTIFFVIHGEMFQVFLARYLNKIKNGLFTQSTTFIGVLVMAVSIFLSALLMENISILGTEITLPFLGAKLLFGYLISFEITAFAFILSAYLFMKVKIILEALKQPEAGEPKSYFQELKDNTKKYFRNKYLFTLTLATLFVGVFQSIMNAFLGVHIYTEYGDVFLGGFLNVGFMLSLSLLIVLIGPAITGKMNKNMGVAPMFVFGTLLMAILPLTLYYNKNFPAIIAANLFGVLGAAMIGSGHNLVSVRLLNEKERDSYYTFSGIVAMIPFLILVTILSVFAQKHNLYVLFRYLGILVVAVLLPIYLLIVVWISKRSDVEKKSI